MKFKRYILIVLAFLILPVTVAAEGLKENPANQTLLEQAEYELLAKSSEEKLRYVATLAKQLKPGLTADGALSLIGDAFGKERSKFIQYIGPKIAEGSLSKEQSQDILGTLEGRERLDAVLRLKGAYEKPLDAEHLMALATGLDDSSVKKAVLGLSDVLDLPISAQSTSDLLDKQPLERRVRLIKSFSLLLPEKINVDELNILTGDLEGRDKVSVFRELKTRVSSDLSAEDLVKLFGKAEGADKADVLSVFAKQIGPMKASEILGIVNDVDEDNRADVVKKLVDYSTQPFTGAELVQILGETKTRHRLNIMSAIDRKGLIQKLSTAQFISALGDLWADDRLKAIQTLAEYVDGPVTKADVGKVLDGIPDVKDRERAVKALSKR